MSGLIDQETMKSLPSPEIPVTDDPLFHTQMGSRARLIHYGTRRIYHGEDHHDQTVSSQILDAHHQAYVRDTHCMPWSTNEKGLARADGHKLKTDCISIMDVDGDGVEVGEVVRAVLMIPPGNESMVQDEGGKLLYEAINHEDEDQSALEVMLRNQVNQLESQLSKVIDEVKSHRHELEDEYARDTHEYLLQKSARLAKEAADLGALLMSDDVAAHHDLRPKMDSLVEVAGLLEEHLGVASDKEAHSQTDERQFRQDLQQPRDKRFVGSWRQREMNGTPFGSCLSLVHRSTCPMPCAGEAESRRRMEEESHVSGPAVIV